MTEVHEYFLSQTREFVWEQYVSDCRQFGRPVAEGEPQRWPYATWPLERVRRVYAHIGRLLSDNGGEVSDEWSETEAALARIVLEEKARVDYTELWNQQKQRQSQRNYSGQQGLRVIY